jgi:hypothetical protein
MAFSAIDRSRSGANRFKMAQMRSARCPLFGRYEGKSDVADIAFFVDTEVIRGGRC